MATAKKAKKLVVPAKVGEAVDLLDRLRDARKAAEAATAAMKAEEALLETEIFRKFKKAELEGARGRRAQCSISRSEVPVFEDQIAFNRYVLRTKSLDLFQNRLSVEAVRERWAAGKAVPGVGKFTKVRLHLSKVRAK